MVKIIIGFRTPDVSGVVTSSRQANQGGALLPSYSIMIAHCKEHSVNTTCT
jgi:hypothetical protein